MFNANDHDEFSEEPCDLVALGTKNGWQFGTELFRQGFRIRFDVERTFWGISWHYGKKTTEVNEEGTR
jgi:hypothetical protein